MNPEIDYNLRKLILGNEEDYKKYTPFKLDEISAWSDEPKPIKILDNRLQDKCNDLRNIEYRYHLQGTEVVEKVKVVNSSQMRGHSVYCNICLNPMLQNPLIEEKNELKFYLDEKGWQRDQIMIKYLDIIRVQFAHPLQRNEFDKQVQVHNNYRYKLIRSEHEFANLSKILKVRIELTPTICRLSNKGANSVLCPFCRHIVNWIPLDGATNDGYINHLYEEHAPAIWKYIPRPIITLRQDQFRKLLIFKLICPDCDSYLDSLEIPFDERTRVPVNMVWLKNPNVLLKWYYLHVIKCH